MPKGIPLSELEGTITDDRTVLKFFQENSQSAFTVSMLLEEGFSTNIRKVVNRLVNGGSLQKQSVKIDGKRWETAYFLAEVASSFVIQKVKSADGEESGWKLIGIECNGFSIKADVLDNEESLWINVTLPPEVDAKIFYRDDNGNLQSLTFSEISPALGDRENFTLEVDFEEYFDGEFDISYSGTRKKESKRRSRVTGEEFTQFAGFTGFNFEVNTAKRFIAIKAVEWIEDDEDGDDGEESRIEMDRVGLGNWDEDEQKFEETIENVSHVLLTF